jgi:hypothetical protein
MLNSRLIPLRFALAGVVLLFAFTAIFVRAFSDPVPHQVRVGVVGPLRPARAALDPREFVALPYPTEASARHALLTDQIRGALVGSHVEIASAYGFVPAQMTLQALTAAAGRPVTVTDVRPLPTADARGLASFFTVMGTTIASLVFALLLTFVGGRHPFRTRALTCALVAVLGGLAVALSVDTVVGALAGAFWGVAGIAALLIAAIVLATHGFARLLGPVGAGVAAITMVLFGISSSGGGVSPQLEPGFYDAISQFLPSGSALTAVRNEVYFAGAHTLWAVAVLVAWSLLGAAALVAGHHRGPLVLRTAR